MDEFSLINQGNILLETGTNELEGIDKIRELVDNLKQNDRISISSQLEKLTNIV